MEGQRSGDKQAPMSVPLTRAVAFGKTEYAIRLPLIRAVSVFCWDKKRGIQVCLGAARDNLAIGILLGIVQNDRNPSICSDRERCILACNGSRIKSSPSRRASFATGTKSLSPATNTIWSASFLDVIAVISMPIFISTPFCRILNIKSLSVISENTLLPLKSCFITVSESEKCACSSASVPKRNATFLFRFSSSKNCLPIYTFPICQNQLLFATRDEKPVSVSGGSRSTIFDIDGAASRLHVRINVAGNNETIPPLVLARFFVPTARPRVSGKIHRRQE